jgi:hypothetical protein
MSSYSIFSEQDFPVNTFSFDWPQSASALVHQAQRGGDLAKLIMAGTVGIESWLIANRILPALDEKGVKRLGFSLKAPHQEKRSASCVPLPDGSAFVCNVLGTWSPLEKHEAAHEMEYIGSRYAPGKCWLGGFLATLSLPDGTASPLTPAEVAKLWMEITGSRLRGFEPGVLDYVEAIGYDVADRVFNTQGRLGL